VSAQGLVDLANDGTVALVEAATVAFGFTAPADQERLVAGFTGWLHGIGPKTQIMVSAAPVSLEPLAARAEVDADGLATSGLQQAGRAHADFLRRLDAEYGLLSRRVVVAVRGRDAAAAVQRGSQALRGLTAAGVRAWAMPAHAVHQLLGDRLTPRPLPAAGGTR
jgi:hypothetical protein